MNDCPLVFIILFYRMTTPTAEVSKDPGHSINVFQIRVSVPWRRLHGLFIRFIAPAFTVKGRWGRHIINQPCTAAVRICRALWLPQTKHWQRYFHFFSRGGFSDHCRPRILLQHLCSSLGPNCYSNCNFSTVFSIKCCLLFQQWFIVTWGPVGGVYVVVGDPN